jgi:hypothetical protein
MLFCSTVCSTWATDFHPLDVKPGQWQTTMTGQPPIPAEVLSRMTPEQRAKMEEAMKAGGQKAAVSQRCITKDRVYKPLNLGGESTKSCTSTLATSSSSKQEIRMECDRNGKKTSGTLTMEAIDSETIKGSMQMSATSDNNRTMNINYAFTSKWIGDACTEPK